MADPTVLTADNLAIELAYQAAAAEIADDRRRGRAPSSCTRSRRSPPRPNSCTRSRRSPRPLRAARRGGPSRAPTRRRPRMAVALQLGCRSRPPALPRGSWSRSSSAAGRDYRRCRAARRRGLSRAPTRRRPERCHAHRRHPRPARHARDPGRHRGPSYRQHERAAGRAGNGVTRDRAPRSTTDVR